jgi:hypothetical protein
VSSDYARGLAEQIDDCFKKTGLSDHRSQYPWLRGWLGDPESPVWFISEAPSEWRLERDGQAEDSPEAQWAISPGDKEFRSALALAGFKEGEPLGPGGWRCYITVLAKSLVDFSTWRTQPFDKKLEFFRRWAPVLDWELAHGSPQLVVAMGEITMKVLTALGKERRLHLGTDPIQIWSYGYLMQPGRNGAPPMDPERIRTYRRQFADLAAVKKGKARPS